MKINLCNYDESLTNNDIEIDATGDNDRLVDVKLGGAAVFSCSVDDFYWAFAMLQERRVNKKNEESMESV